MKWTLSMIGCLLLTVGPLAAQNVSQYPSSFPGGYPSMSSGGGAGKMYMESYFPPPGLSAGSSEFSGLVELGNGLA